MRRGKIVDASTLGLERGIQLPHHVMPDDIARGSTCHALCTKWRMSATTKLGFLPSVGLSLCRHMFPYLVCLDCLSYNEEKEEG